MPSETFCGDMTLTEYRVYLVNVREIVLSIFFESTIGPVHLRSSICGSV